MLHSIVPWTLALAGRSVSCAIRRHASGFLTFLVSQSDSYFAKSLAIHGARNKQTNKNIFDHESLFVMHPWSFVTDTQDSSIHINIRMQQAAHLGSARLRAPQEVRQRVDKAPSTTGAGCFVLAALDAMFLLMFLYLC
jgi:hypothetical protein